MTRREVLAWLERRGSKRNREGMARYAIVAPKVFGVSVATLRQLSKKLGTDPGLAADLWKTGWYEARMLAAFIDDPLAITPSEMERRVVNWALRVIGERNARLHAAAVQTAQGLAASPLPSARWIGKDALRQWATPAAKARLARR